MIKLVTMMRRKSGVSANEFRDHEEKVHVPLVKEIMGADLVQYTRNYTSTSSVTEFTGGIDFDLVVECVFPDMEGFKRAMAAANAPENKARLKEDYSKYLDLSSVRQSLVDVIDS